MYKDIERKLAVITYNQDIKNKLDKVLNFYTQVANAGLKAKETYTLQIRLKWYMQAVQDIYKGQDTYNESIDCLQSIVKEHNIPQYLFQTILQARAIDGDKHPFNSFNDLLLYTKDTSGALWKIFAHIISDSLSENDLLTIEKAGMLFGLVGIIRNTRYGNAFNRYFLDFNPEDNISYKEKSAKVAKLISSYVLKELKTIGKLQNNKLKKLLLLNVFTKSYVNIIKNKNYAVLENEFRKPSALSLLKLMLLMVYY